MKFCQKCNRITGDENRFCAHDGQPLVEDELATALQESLGAKYTVSRLIGRGSMGAVYRAQHHALDNVAIKVMLGPPENHKLSQRFLREARALRKLHHPNAVLVYDLERSSTGLTYMVMELIEGRSLRDEMKERGQPFNLAETIEIAEAASDALDAAHEHGIIHRDLKPDNILLAEVTAADNEVSRVVKIVDFGIAKLRGTQQGGEEASMQLTKYGTPIGTPFYMSPEQWFGDGPGFTALDGRTDIYALGCTLYELLSGYPPFLGQTKDEVRRKHLNEQPRPLHEVAEGVPEAVGRVILRALEKDRDFRPSSAAEFAAELRRAYDESVELKEEEDAPDNSRRAPEPTPGSGGQPTPEQLAQLQATEEADPIIRNWAAEEAQPLIEQVRAHQPPLSQRDNGRTIERAAELPVAEQTPEQARAVVREFEETLVPGALRSEAESVRPDEASAADSDFEQTLVINRGLELAPETEREIPRETDGELCELVVAEAGAWRIGLFSEEVESISEWRVPVPLPGAPPAVLGVVGVHGRMLTVLDARALMGNHQAEETFAPPTSIIALRGDEQLALAVNHVESNARVSPDRIDLPAPEEVTNIVRGVVRSEQGPLIVLDTRELFAAATQGTERRRQRT